MAFNKENKGLRDVIADESKIGFIDSHKGVLAYRGYTVQTLAQNSSFIETSYLLLYGKLPTQSELEAFDKKLRKTRDLPSNVLKMTKLFPPKTHPMVSFQTMVAAIGALSNDAANAKPREVLLDRCIELVAQFPTIIAACWRAKNKKPFIKPNLKLDHSSNFLTMLTGKVPDTETAKMFDVCLILHAEHSFNASTFTARVVASTLSSFHASISGAIGSLYGPLHGGANEKVLEMISEIKSPADVENWVLGKFSRKEKIMGMGHPIYQVKDPRSYILEEMLRQLSQKKNNSKEYEILKKIEEVTRREMEKRGKTDVWPNVDFFSGALYKLMGIPVELFTPLFAMARISGWAAHILEQLEDNRIYRPDCAYVGPHDLAYTPISQR